MIWLGLGCLTAVRTAGGPSVPASRLRTAAKVAHVAADVALYEFGVTGEERRSSSQRSRGGNAVSERDGCRGVRPSCERRQGAIRRNVVQGNRCAQARDYQRGFGGAVAAFDQVCHLTNVQPARPWAFGLECLL